MVGAAEGPPRAAEGSPRAAEGSPRPAEGPPRGRRGADLVKWAYLDTCKRKSDENLQGFNALSFSIDLEHQIIRYYKL